MNITALGYKGHGIRISILYYRLDRHCLGSDIDLH